MSERQARQAVKFYPQIRDSRRPWKNHPSFEAALRGLDALADRKVTRPTPMSLRELAEASGVSERRLEVVAEFFDSIGIRYIERPPGSRSPISVFNLKPLLSGLRAKAKSNFVKAQLLCSYFVESRRWHWDQERLLRWRLRRLERLLQRVVMAIDAALPDLRDSETERDVFATNAAIPTGQARAPPAPARHPWAA